ncbi:MAG: hypothetical protein ACRCSN_02015 [Dermatophilaceae bacterium]
MLVPLWWALEDVAVRDVLVFVGILVLGTAPGVVLWRAIRPAEGSWAEDLTVGFAICLSLGLGGHLAALASGLGPLRIVIPLLPLSVLLVPSRRRRLMAGRCDPAPWWVHVVGAACTVTVVVPLRLWFATQELAPGAERSVPHVDTHFNLALVAQLLHRGPESAPALLGHPLDYHWFTHGWMSWVSGTGGIEAGVVLLRLHPAVMPVVVALAVMGGARRVSGRCATAAVAAPLAFVTAQANAFRGFGLQLPAVPASFTLAPGVPLTVAVLVVLVLRWRGQVRIDGLVLVGVLGFVASCTKGSTMPPLVAGVALAAAVGLVWRHPASRRVWLDLAVLAGVLMLAVAVVFQGATGGLRLDVVDSIGQTALGRLLEPDSGADAPLPVLALAAFTAVVGTLARAGGLAVLAVDRESRRDPVLWVCLGAALASAGALVLFWHPGVSQVYFVLSALPIVAIGSATGLVRLLGAVGDARARALAIVGPALVAFAAVVVVPRTRRIGGADALRDVTVLAGTGALVLCAGAVVLLAVAVKARRRRSVVGAAMVAVLATAGALGSAAYPLRSRLAQVQTAPPAQPVLAPGGAERAEQLRYPQAFSGEQVDAARWLRANTATDDVVMTNRHCVVPTSPLPECDTRRWLVAAFSERQLFIESWAYTSTAVRLNPVGSGSVVEPYWDRADLALNDGFYTSPAADAARSLWCRGVRWVYVDRLLPTSAGLDRFAPVRYRNVDAEVRELVAPAAPSCRGE